MPVKHLKVSAKADGPDPGNVHASDWNASHDLSGLVIADVSDSGVVGRALVKSATVAAALTALTIPNFNLMTVDATGKLTVLVGPTAALDVATKGYVDTGLAAKIGDAPSDTKLYGRKDGAWAEVTSSGGGGAYVLKAGDTMTGPLKIATGTAAAPGLAFASEAGLGWYWRTTGEITTVFGGVVTSVLQAASATATYFVLQPRTAGVSGMFARSTPLLSTDYNQVGLVQNANGTASVQTYAGGAAARGNLILDAPQVLHNDGTVALPNIAFASEPGLGIYRSAAGVIRMAAGGVNTVVFNVATGSMSLTGNAFNAGLYFSKPAGNYYNVIQGNTGSAPRWGINLGDGTAETGTSTGSNFSLVRYDDAAVSTPVLHIIRSNGMMTFGPGAVRAANYTTPPGHASFELSKSAGAFTNQIVGTANGVLRWVLRLGESSTESGSNAGSDFSISRYDDAGVNIGTPISIARATGVMSLGSPVYIFGTTPAPSAVLRLQKLAGANANSLEGLGSNGGTRWALQLGNGSAESTGNAGSDLAIYRYADNGTFLDTAFTMYRSNGAAYFNNQVEVKNNFIVNGYASGLGAQVIMDKATAGEAVLISRNVNLNIWRLIMGDASAGRGVHWQRYDDAGAYLGTSLQINRLNGDITWAGNMWVNGSLSISANNTVGGNETITGSLSAASGCGFKWDGGNYNYTGVGAGLGPGWVWQYQRDTGTIRWLNWEPRSVFQIDGGGGVTAAGVINVSSGGAIYATHLRGGGGNPTSGLFNFNWYDDGTAPSYLWGSSDAVNMRVYPPSRLSVAYAANSGTVGGCSPDRISAWGLSNGNGFAAYYRASADSSIKWLLTTDGGLGLATTQGANTNIYWHNQSGGGGYLGSNPIGGASDERMKENIADSTIDASAQVRAMRFIEFNYKPEVRPGIDTKHHDLGFSAQNLRAIKDALVFDEPDGYMKPDPQEVILTLAKALQETIARLDQLEKT